jgi:hypothetical protein
MFVGGEFGGVKAESSWGFGVTDLPGVVDWGFTGEILVGSPDTETVPPAGGIVPS